MSAKLENADAKGKIRKLSEQKNDLESLTVE